MKNDNIVFHEISLADKEWMDARLAEDDRNACEYSFANNFVWRKVYQVEVAEESGCLVIRFVEQGEYVYSYPIGGGDKRAVIEKLLSICHREGKKLSMSPLSEADRKQLLEWFPGEFFIVGDRDDYDYIYAREKLATLAGKKLHGKRNHIARFKDGDDWNYEPMGEDNLEACRSMTYTWMRMRSEKWNEEMEEEVMVLHEAFDHFKELGLVGGVLYKGGEIVAFCIGEPLNSDTFVVHFEKAFPDMQGAYPMINQQFVLHACEDYAYVNREEDTGDPGLRKAKLSYYPEILLKKYVATDNHVICADPVRDAGQIVKIWQTCFGDEEAYIRFYLEHRMTEDNMLVIYEDGRAVSMASFLPVTYNCGGEYLPARYVYAVATLPEYRNRGFASEILRFARDYYDEMLILAPAEESLILYYEKMGFVRAFAPAEPLSLEKTGSRPAGNIQAAEYDPSAMEDAYSEDVLEEITAEEYARIRDMRLGGEGYVRWDVAAIQYAMDVNASSGGKTCAVVVENDLARPEDPKGELKEILMYVKDGDTLVIEETTLSEKRLQKILPELMEETETNSVRMGQSVGMLWLPEDIDASGIAREGYLNLTLG